MANPPQKDWSYMPDWMKWRCEWCFTLEQLREFGTAFAAYKEIIPPDVRLKCVDIYRAREAQLRR